MLTFTTFLLSNTGFEALMLRFNYHNLMRKVHNETINNWLTNRTPESEIVPSLTHLIESYPPGTPSGEKTICQS